MKLDHVTPRTRDLQPRATSSCRSSISGKASDRSPSSAAFPATGSIPTGIRSSTSSARKGTEAIAQRKQSIMSASECRAMQSFARSSINSVSATQRWTSLISMSAGCSFARPAAHCSKPSFPNPFARTTEPSKESSSCRSSRKCRSRFGYSPFPPLPSAPPNLSLPACSLRRRFARDQRGPGRQSDHSLRAGDRARRPDPDTLARPF